jgi:hypothetical protein
LNGRRPRFAEILLYVGWIRRERKSAKSQRKPGFRHISARPLRQSACSSVLLKVNIGSEVTLK